MFTGLGVVMTIKTVHLTITGKVQEVWFRAWTQENAERMGVNGWVRNKSDGSVEAVLSGPENAVDDMVSKCHQGPIAAKVKKVEMEAYPDLPPKPGFHQLPTA
jgi:acylphosphatase